MTLYDAIYVRKSTRVYEPASLGEDMLSDICGLMSQIRPLDSRIPVGLDIVDTADMRHRLSGRAPHCLVLYSAEQAHSFCNAGFIMEQMNLGLSTMNLGSCFLGMAKPTLATKRGLEHVITLAFGKTDENPHHYPGEQKRQLMEAICTGSDPRIEAARLAPSALNGQPWYFVCADGAIDVYVRRHNPIKAAILRKMNQIDMGIALCHLYLASEEMGLPFDFSFDATPVSKRPRGYTFLGQVKA